MDGDFLMSQPDKIWYGVEIVRGKIIATIYPNKESIPEGHIVATNYELEDLTNKIYYGK